MRRVVCLLLFVLVVSPPTIRNGSLAQETQTTDGIADRFENELAGPVSVDEIAATTSWANSFVDTTHAADWLGPLAPVALSPFFGVTLLSGMSLWGPEWMTDNALLGASGPLRHQGLFFAFLALTIATSVPRLTKVSKPFAQAVDRLETYAVIVILLVVKVVSSMDSPVSPGEAQVAMVQLGIFSFTVDALLAIAMVVNVLVINSVKFFFEFLVWLTPVPFLDAVFEVCNKSVCAALMAIYAYSPTLATIINLSILLVAAVILRWISRRVRFYRTMVLDPIIAKLWSGFGTPKKPELIVFPKSEFGPFKPLSRLSLTRAEGDQSGWMLREANWWMPANEYPLAADLKPSVRCGWIMNSVETTGSEDKRAEFTFSRRYNDAELKEMLDLLGMEVTEKDPVSPTSVAGEFA
ncbi:MAG: hypothetical protein AB8B91_15090 [Rubripirellula sp.]